MQFVSSPYQFRAARPVDVNMSIPGQPSIAHTHALERAPCSQPHTLFQNITQAIAQKKKKKILEVQGTSL
jgi:hypothetical protein